MDFLGLLKDLRGQIGKTALKRTGALTQLAGAVKGMSDALVSEADEAIREVGRARIRVYMPAKAKAVARTRTRTKTARVKDAEATYLQDLVKQQKKQTVERFAELRDLYIKLLKKSPEFSEAGMAKRRKLIAAVVTKREETLAAKREHEEEVREKHAERFKGSIWEPKTATIGKTEDYKAYMAELSEAYKKEQKETTEALGKGILSRFYLATTSEYKKEYEKAIKTGTIVKKGDDEDREKLVDKLGEHIETVKYSVSEMHDEMSALLLGPFAGMYKTAKGFMFTTGKHFILERKEKVKNWLMERFDRKKLLAEMKYLRKEGKEVPAALKMQMVVSTAMNAMLAGIGALLKASPFILGGALLGKFIVDALGKFWTDTVMPVWPFGKTSEQKGRESSYDYLRLKQLKGEKLSPAEEQEMAGLKKVAGKAPLSLRTARAAVVTKEQLSWEQKHGAVLKGLGLPELKVETKAMPTMGERKYHGIFAGFTEKIGGLMDRVRGLTDKIDEGMNRKPPVVQTIAANAGGGGQPQVLTYLELMSSEDETINWPK